MTYPLSLVEQALQLHARGWNPQRIADSLGVSRSAVRSWLADPDGCRYRLAALPVHEGAKCSLIDSVPSAPYAYLLGQYLGDGCISPMGSRGVFRLRIATCDQYPAIRQQTLEAVRAVMPANKVGVAQSIGCSEVGSYSKHWPCLFPQHGPGKKHERRIVLADWQQQIVDACPREFLTGLIHSDGSRSINVIKKNGKVYTYPRYFFTNTSDDIRNLFCATCDASGVAWKQNNWNCISIARATDGAYLDQFIGPKT